MTRLQPATGEPSGLDGRPMAPECRVALVIPYLDEAALLPACLATLSTAMDAVSGGSLEVILVDNGSVDASAEIVHEWAAGNGGKCPVHLIREPRQGIGWARSAGASAAFSRAASRVRAAGTAFWVLSADSDCTFPDDYFTRWFAHLFQATSPILAGDQTFGQEFSLTYPVIDSVWRDLGSYRDLLEASFHVINTDGFNHAIEQSAYAKVGPYRQPVIATATGPRNAAGEDWDLGTRARAAGIRPQRVASTIRSSPRRVLADPWAYFTGTAYEGEFKHIEHTSPGPDLPAGEYASLCAEGRRRMLLHYASKPFLVDQELQKDLMRLMPAQVQADISLWTGRAYKMDLSMERNEFILDMLVGFWEKHADHLARIANGGTSATYSTG